MEVRHDNAFAQVPPDSIQRDMRYPTACAVSASTSAAPAV
jgi:hypothetical protein